MKNNSLLKISITVFLLGIILLEIIDYSSPIKKMNISEITYSDLNKKVKITGKIEKINNYKDSQLITLNDNTGKIKIFLDKKLNLSKEKIIIVEGRISEYKNILEIKSDKIIID